jgi:cyclase
MATWQYTKGLHELGNGCYAWLQPDGHWGYSNSGLVTDGDNALLVDTLFDVAHTREMLEGYRSATAAANSIGVLVNTHSNGDHTYGNQLLPGARIVASRVCAEEMALPFARPEERAVVMRDWERRGAFGRWLNEIYGIPDDFHFDDVVYTPPTETFDKECTLKVGAKDVKLIEVGPAHTGGDVIAWVPQDRTLFTGDILFIGGHPVVWAGPVSNWVRACDLILDLDVETIVPGHGPITDKNAVREFRAYLEFIATAARKRYDAGIGVEEAARDIACEAYKDWLDAERMVINVACLYREFSAGQVVTEMENIFAWMHRLRKDLAARGRH